MVCCFHGLNQMKAVLPKIKPEWHSHISGFQLALRVSVAAGVSVAIAYLLKLEYPIYAFLAAVIVTDLTPAQSRELGLLRIFATAVGAVCGAGLSSIWLPGALTIGASVLIAMLICQLLSAREGAKIAGLICGIVVLDHSSAPWTDALARFFETGIGVVAAWGVSYVPKLIRLEQQIEQDIAKPP